MVYPLSDRIMPERFNCDAISRHLTKDLTFGPFNNCHSFSMKKILLFGAGKSATCLIQYLVRATAARNWQLVVADSNLSLARSKIGDNAPHARAVVLQVEDQA